MQWALRYKRSIIAAVILLAGMGLTRYVSRAEVVPGKRPFADFPKTIGAWSGKEERFDQRIYDILGVDDSFLGDFVASDGRYVQLYIGFYASQREGDLIHSPRNCMPGAGWNITKISRETIRNVRSPSGRSEVIKLLLEKGPQKQVVLYWFHSRGRIIASEYLQKIYLVVDAIFRHRTDGSFVRLIAPADHNNVAAATQNLKDFAKELMPILDGFIPS